MKKAIIALLIYVFFVLFGADLIYQFLELFSDDKLFLASLSNFFLYLILVVIFIILYKDTVKESIKNFKNQNITFITIFNCYLILMGASIIGNLILMILGKNDQSINQKTIEILLNSKYAIFTASGAIIGCFVEEIVYRKSIFDIFHEKYKFNPILTCIISGIAFGLIHVIFNISDNNYDELIMSIPYMTQGIALAYMYITYKKNIMVPVAVHTLSNFIAILLVILM